jgi:hypothetical protein
MIGLRGVLWVTKPQAQRLEKTVPVMFCKGVTSSRGLPKNGGKETQIIPQTPCLLTHPFLDRVGGIALDMRQQPLALL